MDRCDGRAKTDPTRKLGLERIDKHARAALYLEVLPLAVVRVEDAADAGSRARPGQHRTALERASRRSEGLRFEQAVRHPRRLERPNQRSDREIIEAFGVRM